jgi:alpha-glucosidase
MATAMSAFWSGKTMTTNDVMDVTDLTRVTAHAVCDDLIARGWILEARAFHRSGGEAKGRDGCRVPLPWTLEGPSLGFGDHVGHLPQPGWFAELSVEAQEHDLASTLNLYRRALGVRRSRRAAGDAFGWVDSDSNQVLHFRRPGGWHSLTNFGSEPVDLPSGSVAVSSDALEGDRLPPNTTAWIIGQTDVSQGTTGTAAK